MRYKDHYIKSFVSIFCIILLYGCGGQSKDPDKSGIRGQTADKKTKLAAITFDDGPYGDATVQILDILNEKDVKATFFVMGMRAQQYPDLLKREVQEGHLIGNHSFDHSKRLYLLSKEKLLENIKNADGAIADAAGVHPKIFRPPYGYESPWMVNDLKKAGYSVIRWNDATEDYYMKESPDKITKSILRKLKKRAVIDLHDGRDIQPNYSRENLIKALPVIIDKIREKGYTFVTVDKIIKRQPYFSSPNKTNEKGGDLQSLPSGS